jgi:hypothetical protein
VQSYIQQFGARKCEANALVVAPQAGRQLCREAILEHIHPDDVTSHNNRLMEARARLQQALREAIP